MALQFINIPLPPVRSSAQILLDRAEIDKTVTQEGLKKVFLYKEGKLYRRNKAGDLHEAGGVNKSGYVHVRFLGPVYLAHRLIWCYVYGTMPIGEIDHIDHDKANNHIENLREVTRSEQMQNASQSKVNTSGVTGVSWCKWHKKYSVYIGAGVSHKMIRLGYFESFEEAVAARKASEIAIGYHENHGTPLPLPKSLL